MNGNSRPGRDPSPVGDQLANGGLVAAWRVVLAARDHLPEVMRSAALGAILASVGLVAPLLSRLLIDSAYPSNDVALAELLVASVAAFSIASAVVSAVRSVHAQWVMVRLNASVGRTYINHLTALPLEFFERRLAGELLARLTELRTGFGSVVQLLSGLAVSGALVALVPPVLLLLDWRLAIVALLPYPVVAIMTGIVARAAKGRWTQSASAVASLAALETRMVSQMKAIKLQSVELAVRSRHDTLVGLAVEPQLSVVRLGAWSGLAIGVVKSLGFALFSWIAWHRVLEGEMTLGGMIAFTAYVGMLSGPAAELSSLSMRLQGVVVSLERAYEYLAASPEPGVSTAAPARRFEFVDIEFRSVSCRYADGTTALQGCNLLVSAGTSIAIIGPSGAGKTSLLRAMLRHVPVSSGELLLAGEDVRSIDLAELRANVLLVSQDALILGETARDEIALRGGPASDEEIKRVISDCRLDTYFAALPGGIDGKLGELGSTMSAGQRQRLALASALLVNPPVLLLDEPTSALDGETEAQVVSALLRRRAGKTTIVVTHRESVAARVDSCALVVEGRVVATGPHGWLALRESMYSNSLSDALSSPSDDEARDADALEASREHAR